MMLLEDPAYETNAKTSSRGKLLSDVIYGALTPEQELRQQIDQSKELDQRLLAKAFSRNKV